eukprot:scaffold162_cov176-Amphora_coffeaeformis.AAC.13
MERKYNEYVLTNGRAAARWRCMHESGENPPKIDGYENWNLGKLPEVRKRLFTSWGLDRI